MASGGAAAARVALWLGIGAGIALSACSDEVVAFEALDLLLTADPTDPPVARLQIALRNTTDGAPYAAPAQAGDAQFEPALPTDWSLSSKPWRLRIQQPAAAQGKLAIRIAGLDNAGTLRAVYSGVIDTRTKGEKAVRLLAVGSQPQCDADADGVPACKTGCLADPTAQCDCNDDATLGSDGKPKGAAASPFFAEDSCLQCGDGIDQNCDGSDAPCVDKDGDKVADCQEKSCPPGGDADPSIYPGAAESCNGTDDDCDGVIDDGLPYVDVQGKSGTATKGDACGTGLGRCEGGSVVCAADGKGLVCSTADKKLASEDCGNAVDDDCDGDVNDGCASQDLDGDGVPNTDETAEDCPLFPQAALHAEYFPGATEGCCPAGKTDASCDFNCDGKVTACPADDQDGDGVPTPADCDDANPAIYPGAPQQCGDGQKPCPVDSDPPCTNDKDGDKFNADVDCNDSDALVYPGAPERCNGVDDDCDGKKDEGNPEAGGVSCGDPDGECGKTPGVLVCKHYPAGAKPDALDCGTRAFDLQSATCVGCHADVRPATDTCNTLDDDCDGSSDEDFTYVEHGGQQRPMFGTCDGIGACGSGVVECASAASARCSTDPGGSAAQNQPEVCNNLDDSCDGQTDENLTSVGDSLCQKSGVCGANLTSMSAVCTSGVWRCDYSKVTGIEFGTNTACDPAGGLCHCPADGGACVGLAEVSCDGLDNDCDGKTDDGFSLDGATIGAGCGTGLCAGGKVVCSSDAKGLVCSSAPKATAESCNLADDDCDGSTDESSDLPVTLSPCLLVGVCSAANVKASCATGKWSCDYSAVDAYQAASETTCDALDNDCDGQTDEDFVLLDWNLQSRALGAVCGTGKCAGGKAICAKGGSGLVCSTAGQASASPEPLCNGDDDDCDGQTDEDFAYTEQAGAVLGVGAACDGIGACGLGVVECHDSAVQAVCSSDPEGSSPQVLAEVCNDADDDCDGALDEGCDLDGDDYCAGVLATESAPAVCPGGGGDCRDDDETIHPAKPERCDGVDNDCDGETDAEFQWASDGAAPLPVAATCGTGVCTGGIVTCDSSGESASCPTLALASTETCNNLDDDCDGATDEGCDDDEDGFCDAAMPWSEGAVVCPNTTTSTALDCDDKATGVYPGQVELCDGIDNGCSAGADEGCDDDGDLFCDAAMERVGEPSICPLGGADCDDEVAAISPAALEVCDDLDNDCNAGPDNGCDDDNDKYCDAAIGTIGAPAICPGSALGSLDCDDQNAAVNPDAAEVCNGIDDGCNNSTDAGCDDDGDKYCDANMLVAENATICPFSAPGMGDDCNDLDKLVFVGQTESCNGKDDNCDGQTDPADASGCDVFYLDGDRDGWGTSSLMCLCEPEGYYDALVSGDCQDGLGAVNPGQDESCNTAADDDCNGKTSEKDAIGCSWFAKDSDSDGYAASASDQQCWCVADAASGYAVPLPLAGTDCNDGDKTVFPGKPEVCGNAIDDNCIGGTDEGCGP